MNIYNQDRESPVILSAAKNLSLAREILRGAQNDISDFDWYVHQASLDFIKGEQRFVIPWDLLFVNA
jgi:hypothetical protein